ncbi:MAG TPA: hypothetical protein VFM68_02980 [Candidatus Saccharimonadales bacterium]|nr:hypothetical protein [Candidatus Saccharimonadales bacterium]
MHSSKFDIDRTNAPAEGIEIDTATAVDASPNQLVALHQLAEEAVSCLDAKLQLEADISTVIAVDVSSAVADYLSKPDSLKGVFTEGNDLRNVMNSHCDRVFRPGVVAFDGYAEKQKQVYFLML